MKNTNSKEGNVAGAVETEKSKIPSDLFLWTAPGAMTLSIGLRCEVKKCQQTVEPMGCTNFSHGVIQQSG